MNEPITHNEQFFSLFEQFKNEARPQTFNMNDRVLVVDLLNTFMRSFSASPAMNDDGDHCGGLTGTLYSMGSAIRQFNATRCIVVADGEEGSKRRRQLYPDYKKKSRMSHNLNRTYNFKNDEEEVRAMKLQLGRLVDYLRCLPIQFVAVNGVEADDAIAYIVNDILNESTCKITVMSSDRDFLQLVDDRVHVWSPTKKKLYTPKEVVEEYKVSPKNFLFYKILMGDSSDNIPGVDGCGKVTIPKYLQLLSDDAAHSVDKILKVSEEANAGKKKLKFYDNILQSKEKLALNEELMQLQNPYIVDHSKLEISKKVNGEITRLNKHEVHLMYIHDRLSGAMLNISEWLVSTFTVLNSFALQNKTK